MIWSIEGYSNWYVIKYSIKDSHIATIMDSGSSREKACWTPYLFILEQAIDHFANMKDTVVDRDHATALGDVARTTACFGPFIVFAHLVAGWTQLVKVNPFRLRFDLEDVQVLASVEDGHWRWEYVFDGIHLSKVFQNTYAYEVK